MLYMDSATCSEVTFKKHEDVNISPAVHNTLQYNSSTSHIYGCILAFFRMDTHLI